MPYTHEICEGVTGLELYVRHAREIRRPSGLILSHPLGFSAIVGSRRPGHTTESGLQLPTFQDLLDTGAASQEPSPLDMIPNRVQTYGTLDEFTQAGVHLFTEFIKGLRGSGMAEDARIRFEMCPPNEEDPACPTLSEYDALNNMVHAIADARDAGALTEESEGNGAPLTGMYL